MITSEQKKLIEQNTGISWEEYAAMLGDPANSVEVKTGSKGKDSSKITASGRLPIDDDEGFMTIKPKAKSNGAMAKAEADSDDFLVDDKDDFDEESMPEFAKAQGQVEKILTQEGYPDLMGWLDGPVAKQVDASLESAFEALDKLGVVREQYNSTPKEVSRIAIESIHAANGFTYSPEEGIFSKIWGGITKAIKFIVDKILAVFRWMGEKLGLRSKELGRAIDECEKSGGYNDNIDYEAWGPAITQVEQNMGSENIGNTKSIKEGLKGVAVGLFEALTSDTAKKVYSKVGEGASKLAHKTADAVAEAKDSHANRREAKRARKERENEINNYGEIKENKNEVQRLENLLGQIVYARQMLFSHRTLVCLGGFKRSSLMAIVDSNFANNFQQTIQDYNKTFGDLNDSLQDVLTYIDAADKNNQQTDQFKNAMNNRITSPGGQNSNYQTLSDKSKTWDFTTLAPWKDARIEKDGTGKGKNAAGSIEYTKVSFVRLSQEKRDSVTLVSGSFKRDIGITGELENLFKDYTDTQEDKMNTVGVDTYFDPEAEKQIAGKYGILREHYSRRAEKPIKDMTTVLQAARKSADGISNFCQNLDGVEGTIKNLSNMIDTFGKRYEATGNKKINTSDIAKGQNKALLDYAQIIQKIAIAVLRPLGKLTNAISQDAIFYVLHLTQTINAQTDAVKAFNDLSDYKKKWFSKNTYHRKDAAGKEHTITHRVNVNDDEGLDPDTSYNSATDNGDDFDL